MILQALTEYYDTLREQGEVDAPGWSPAKVSFALYIREDGTLERVVSLKTEQSAGKKTVLLPRSMELPCAPSGRTSTTVKPAFLWDNVKYLLGLDTDGKPCPKYFQGSKTLHHALLSHIDTPAARAVSAFFNTWEPEKASQHPALAACWEEILSKPNMVFRCAEGFVHEDPAVRAAWDRHYNQVGDGPKMVCIVTGEKVPAESIHPSIKGVPGAKSSGAALVSFNAPALCSYGKDQA